MSTRLPLVFALLALTPACVVDDPGTTAAAKKAPDDCGSLVCGNAAELDGQPFWELDWTGAEFSPQGGFRIKSFKQGATSLELQVVAYHLLGIKPDHTAIGDAGLAGAKLVVESKAGLQYEITIDWVSSTSFYEDGNDGTSIPTFALSYRRLGSKRPPQAVCPLGDVEPGSKVAILFTGDRYSQQTGGVIATGGDAFPWFNIACHKDALWKMVLFRHITFAQDATHTITIDDRDAALRAIRADYCGDGAAWTETGTDVDWANRGGWLYIDDDTDMVEAIWDGDGAVCIRNPRLDGYTLADIECDPAVHPPIHPCTSAQVANWIADGHSFVTYRPAP